MVYDLIIIGGGPAGYVSAIRAGQLGMKTLLIEKSNVGGMCLKWGCIPSKSLLESAKFFQKIGDAKKFGIDGVDKKSLSFNWQAAVKKASTTTTRLTKGIEFLLNKSGVEVIYGEAKIVSEKSVSVENRNFSAGNIIIATGSKPEETEAKDEISIQEFYALEKLPENIIFMGYGPVSAELAHLSAMAGVKSSIFGKGDKLVLDLDDYLNEFLLKRLKKDKIQFIENENDIPTDALRVNSRMRNAILPQTSPALKLDKNGFIETDDNFRTSIDGIFAIGDVTGKSSYAHLGSAQGLFVVNKLKGIVSPMDFKRFPINIYTYPEIAQIGLTEQELKAEGYNYKVSSFPISANAKAMINGETEGEVRILSEHAYGEVMGVQIIAENATDMIAEASAYMSMEGTIYDIAATIHAHPTVSEIFMEAGFEAVDKAVHK
jgi:dihydrolipoamide dehydrogenase